MNQLANIMRREAGRAGETKSYARRAIVTAYDPDHYAAKVEIQPEGFETGFLPIGSTWVGPGWGMFCPPSPGDEVDLHFQEGGKNAAYISLRFYGNEAPPLSVSSGEFWLVHQSGSAITLKNDGTVNITAASTVNVTAPLINVGSDGESLHKIVTDEMVALFNGHTHSGPPPDQQMGDAQLTSVLNAG